MTDFRSIIETYGFENFAADIGVAPNTAKQMRTRNSVPPGYWPTWVKRAHARGRGDITLERLASAYQRRREQRGREQSGRAA